ncbi:MAG: DMT family transporter [Flavobacteriales bacterium]|nr:DMT family transporter [Flavobacteriales bacterium]
MMLQGRNANLILLHFIVLIWGLTGILGNEISLTSIPLVWWRVFIAACALALFAVAARRRIAASSKEIMSFLGVGVLTAAHWICFFSSIKFSKVSVALAVISTTSFFVALVAPLIRRERFMWYEVWLGMLVVAGLFLIFKFEPQYTVGILLALAASLFAAIFSSINSILVRRHEPVRIAFWEMTGACVATGIYLLVSGVSTADMTPGLRDFLLLLVLGVLCTAFAFVAGIEVMKVLSPFTCALAINLEPVYTIAIALFMYGESEYMSAQFYLGTIVILSTLFIEAWLHRRQAARK